MVWINVIFFISVRSETPQIFMKNYIATFPVSKSPLICYIWQLLRRLLQRWVRTCDFLEIYLAVSDTAELYSLSEFLCQWETEFKYNLGCNSGIHMASIHEQIRGRKSRTIVRLSREQFTCFCFLSVEIKYCTYNHAYIAILFIRFLLKQFAPNLRQWHHILIITPPDER